MPQRNDRAAIAQTIEVIRPRLHHLAALGEILRAIIRTPHFVALRMGELEFDPVGVPALLVETGGRH